MARTTSVLITGCSTGIGRVTARHLAARGHRVYATARRVESIDDLRADGCEVLALDVTDEASMQAAVATVQEREGVVGALVNNAGYSQSGPVELLDPDDLRRQFETNVFGLVRLTQLVLPGMRAAGWGRIVNLSSMGGRMTLPGGGAYHATKYAVEALSDALRYEVKPFGVAVVLIEPGPVHSDFGVTANASMALASEGQGETTADNPYATFNAGVATVVARAYAGRPKGKGRPEAIAAVVDRAIRSRRPNARYLVGRTARSLVGLHAVLPDSLWDRFLATVYPRPNAGS